MRIDRRWELYRTRSVGEHRAVAVRSAGQERQFDLTLAPAPVFFAPTYVFGGLADLIVCLTALLMLARAGRRWTGFLLGLALVCYALPGNYPRFWQNAPALYLPFLIGLSTIWAASPTIMLLALRNFRRDTIGAVPRWLGPLIAVVAAADLIALVLGLNAYIGVASIFGTANGLNLISLAVSAGSMILPLALATGWRAVPTPSRTRYAFMLAAISAFALSAAIDPIIMFTGNDYVSLSWPVLIQLAALIAGAVLFAYALLRHRVIDLGFAINRTLVYSGLSFVTLLVFGLVEWGSERLLPLESREASVIIEAGVALTLFMVFHRVHAWIEGLVERVFFHEWHANDEALQRFLHRAGYIASADVLLERAVGELERFTGGATVAFYRAARGRYDRAAGSAARPWIDIDAPASVEMRADQALVRDAFADGGLGLPMLHRADVTGIVLIGPKPSGDRYRPDEEAALAEAVRRIGLDLYALRVEELEAANASLSARLAVA